MASSSTSKGTLRITSTTANLKQADPEPPQAEVPAHPRNLQGGVKQRAGTVMGSSALTEFPEDEEQMEGS
jgi:hypothetical protein